jgi:transcription factor C subunit 6
MHQARFTYTTRTQQPVSLDAKYSTKDARGKGTKNVYSGDDKWRTVAVSWPPEASVLRLDWQTGTGLAHAGLLASGTGSGLGRVDIFNERRDAGGSDDYWAQSSVKEELDDEDME